MLTSAITAAIVTLLTWLGVEPGLYVAGVWLAVKALVLAAVAMLAVRAARRRRLDA